MSGGVFGRYVGFGCVLECFKQERTTKKKCQTGTSILIDIQFGVGGWARTTSPVANVLYGACGAVARELGNSCGKKMWGDARQCKIVSHTCMPIANQSLFN